MTADRAGATERTITLLGAPVEEGAGQLGCGMGPSALHVAGLQPALEKLGHTVIDRGNLAPDPMPGFALAGNTRNAPVIAGWTRALERAAFETLQEGAFPIFLGGDHSLSMGSVAGVARHAAAERRPLFVLWLDAHADFNTPQTSPSGNMHGMSVAFFSGLAGFEGILPASRPIVRPDRVSLLGVRSIDADERTALTEARVNVHDMRAIDEFGIVPIVRSLIETVGETDGLLHVSLDVDFLDPSIAPGVGTTVRGGATYREAHLVMELLSDSGLVSSMDLVELNPFLDMRGQSALLLVELVSSLFGQEIFEKPSRRV
ncbi:MAG TPA: arginase [Pararhizobium sp.]|nr:arginase [Pararhizobium sp.]